MFEVIVNPQRQPQFVKKSEQMDSFVESLKVSFEKNSVFGLLSLAVIPEERILDDKALYWRRFVRFFLSECAAYLFSHKEEGQDWSLDLLECDLAFFLDCVPFGMGSEYQDATCLKDLWTELTQTLNLQIKQSGLNYSDFFAQFYPEWYLQGQVILHLAENKDSEESPFAFLATFLETSRKEGKNAHRPLSYALEVAKTEEKKRRLVTLLSPIQRAAQECSILKQLMDTGDIFEPQFWSSHQAYLFLKNIPVYEKAGLKIRAPNWWKKRPRTELVVKIGDKKPSLLGQNGLLDFQVELRLGDKPLTKKEVESILKKADQLVFFKGQWVELDSDKLKQLMEHWQDRSEGVTFSEAMRMLSGTTELHKKKLVEQERFMMGKWLQKTLSEIRSTTQNQQINQVIEKHLSAKLRPYQKSGVHWLYFLNRLQLGCVLADDMGLGKTIQLISLILLKKHYQSEVAKPVLLILPASLVGNWLQELSQFAPQLQVWVAHASHAGSDRPEHPVDVVITTYGYVRKVDWIFDQHWELIVCDEAQAIKNPNAQQTQSLKKLKAAHKIAMTGTPVENQIADLWSLFDFVQPGLLSTLSDFQSYFKQKKDYPDGGFSGIKTLLSPYIMRRLKTDRSIIQDLPDKTEVKVFCGLSRSQILLYQKAVKELAEKIEMTEGMKRRGLVLSYLMKLKQICNHSSHFLKDGLYCLKDSGKFIKLTEICEMLVQTQQKALIFTQFREMTEPLASFCSEFFQKPALVLNGDTDIKKRQQLVKDFQDPQGPSVFILSLKAGGTGLNLTQASHVIHFDRWWNPAVENQATDRAFRIGQKKNVMVHKFITAGTLEEKIDLMIESKIAISQQLIDAEGSLSLTELSNDQLLKIVSMDLNKAAFALEGRE